MEKHYKTSSLIIGMIMVAQVHAQISRLDNGPGASGDYVGWNNATTIPLEIRHNATNQPIDFFSNTVQRMRINSGNATFTGIGGSAATPGFVGIGVSPTDIRSRLTITGENNSGAFPGGGFRTWMKTGVFTLENSDNMYVGMKEEGGTDRSDAVVA